MTGASEVKMIPILGLDVWEVRARPGAVGPLRLCR